MGLLARARKRLTVHHILAAELRPESQKLLWRMQVTSHERDFFTGRSEGQKVEQTRMGVRAAAAESDSALRAEGAPNHQTVRLPVKFRDSNRPAGRG